MRTRFLAADYSTATATGGGGPVETLDFVHLPLPHLPSPNCPSFSANFLQSFHEIPDFGISGKIDKLPIDDALSIFLSDVLPHFVNGAGFDEPRIGSNKEKSERRSEIYYGGKELDRLGFDKMEEKDLTTSSNYKGGDGHLFVQFEIPEMDISLLPVESGVYTQIECLHNFSEVPEAEFTVYLLNSELTLHDPAEVQQTLYLVDDISVEYLMEQKADLLEDGDSVQGKFHSNNIKFPVFEVDMEILGVPGRIYTMDELLSFENIEKQEVMQPDGEISNKELLGSMESDWIKNLFHHSAAILCLEDTISSSELDFICIIELSHCHEYSTLRGNPDGYSTWLVDPILFDEFVFFDLDPYHFYEVFSDSAMEIEAETCEYLFGEAMNFRSFSQLIVCHELTLMDDSFKSLPIPIFLDQGNTSSLHTLVEELFVQLDWQSSSASDGLYLDWHFLGGDDCESAKYPSLWEIDTYSIDVNMNLGDSGKLIFDFLISEDHYIKPNAENCKEILNLSCNDVSILHSSGKADLSSLRNHVGGERMNDDILLKTGVRNVLVFGESMSSDLEFFLNPRNYVVGTENIPADRSVDTDTVGQVLMPPDDSASAQKDCKTKLEELLNTIPVMETYGNEPVEAVNEDKGCKMMPVQSKPVGLESKQNLSCKPFGPNTVIIVNTRNFNEEMVISRRSTYQKILEMEQAGAQVVERDIGLPVDVIVSSSICLTWYNCRNIGKKASAPDEAFSCLPLCVESIAASVLTSLSFAFSCCILIFEGECNFLCSIMESSDELYAAAASLGIDIQLFCSYSHDMTEEIITSCINVAAKLTGVVYPKMSDLESLAESFLTAFPSINPLSAHAILSSDAILGKFLELSNGGKIRALQKYQVPDECIALLSVISKYGEREDSKSGVTDCSSSLSVPDSENLQFKSAPETKKPKDTHKLYTAGEPTNDLLHMESEKLLPDDQHDLPKCNSWLSGGAEISKSEQFRLSFNDKLPCHTWDIDDDMMNSIDKLRLYDFPLAKGLQISDERENPWMPPIDIDCSPRWRSSTTLKNTSSRQSKKVNGTLQGSSNGEVIDLEETTAFGEKFFDSSSFSPTLLDAEKDYAARNSRTNKRPPSATNLPIFTNPTEIHVASGASVSRNDKSQILREESKPHFDIINRDNISMMRRKGFVEEDIAEKVPQNSYKQSFQEKGTRSFGGTPLSNALHSTQPQGSPWTIEFLNRIREKSRLRKQSVSYDLSYPSFGSGNTSKATKRKSPSILEFYKYKGGNTPQKIVEEKRLKRFSPPPNSLKTKKASASCPSLTPVDKRARRTLSFSTNGSGGQSKLVWRDNNYQTTQRRL